MKKSLYTASILLILLILLILAGSLQTYNDSRKEVPAVPTNAGDVKYFGNEASGDLNGDGKDDLAFIFTNEPGGSGTFYYVAAALKGGQKDVITNSVLLGDRIAPQSTLIEDGEIVVNYADRKGGEPMSTQPSVGVTSYFKVVDGKLIYEGSR